MKAVLYLAAIISFLGVVICGVQSTANAEDLAELLTSDQTLPVKDKTPVLVELFTSEGCATCPPADRNLALLEKEQSNPAAEIITLALHVDYWNGPSWTDKYSSAVYSQRQQIYGSKFKISSIYTPQMVVDGSRHFVGSNLGEAQRIISDAAKLPKATIDVSASGDTLKVKISAMPKHEMASVYLAIAEDNLSTEVKKGENGGRVLQHSSVARILKPLGRILPENNEFEIETALDMQPDWKKPDLKIIVFVQENQSRKILGVMRKTL